MQNYYGENQLHRVDLLTKTHNQNPYPKGFSKVDLKPGKSGKWCVEKFSVTDAQVGLHNLRLIRDGRWDRVVPPGDYTKLVRNNVTVMSDTPAEANEHRELYKRARGRVLINGLGLGFGLKAILTKDEVREVTVVEKSKDVIKLVGKQIKDPRVTIVNADAFDYQPVGKYSFAWHDIWNTISGDNEVEIDRLLIKYNGIARKQGAWSDKYM